jgi:hypothetical protein
MKIKQGYICGGCGTEFEDFDLFTDHLFGCGDGIGGKYIKKSEEKEPFKIRVNHELGFFSFYEIEALNYNEAQRLAEKKFLDQYCGGKLESDVFAGVKYKLESFTFNKQLE